MRNRKNDIYEPEKNAVTLNTPISSTFRVSPSGMAYTQMPMMTCAARTKSK
jgi:hypothetical protein